jgi:hypothetical protein
MAASNGRVAKVFGFAAPYRLPLRLVDLRSALGGPRRAQAPAGWEP